MNVFRVENMTCGHCVATIKKAIQAVDAPAAVEVDLASSLVRIDSDEANAAQMVTAIGAAGYPAAPAGTGAGFESGRGTTRRSCCCG